MTEKEEKAIKRRIFAIQKHVAGLIVPYDLKMNLLRLELMIARSEILGGLKKSDLKKKITGANFKKKYPVLKYVTCLNLKKGMDFKIERYQDTFKKRYKKDIRDVFNEGIVGKTTSLVKLITWDSTWTSETWFKLIWAKKLKEKDSQFIKTIGDVLEKNEFKKSDRKDKKIESLMNDFITVGINPYFKSEGHGKKLELSYKDLVKEFFGNSMPHITAAGDRSYPHKYMKRIGMDKKALAMLDR